MSDDKFHLTPVDIRHQEFKAAMRGYDKVSVDVFRQQVADEMERLVRQNQDLDTRAKGFQEQLRAFRERDKALNDALISAQQLRAEIREQAEREAQLILREARAEGERLLETMRGEIRRLEEQLQLLERSRRAYLAQMRQLVERQVAEIEAAESAPAPVLPQAAGEGGRRPHNTPAWLDSLTKE